MQESPDEFEMRGEISLLISFGVKQDSLSLSSIVLIVLVHMRQDILAACHIPGL